MARPLNLACFPKVGPLILCAISILLPLPPRAYINIYLCYAIHDHDLPGPCPLPFVLPQHTMA